MKILRKSVLVAVIILAAIQSGYSQGSKATEVNKLDLVPIVFLCLIIFLCLIYLIKIIMRDLKSKEDREKEKKDTYLRPPKAPGMRW